MKYSPSQRHKQIAQTAQTTTKARVSFHHTTHEIAYTQMSDIVLVTLTKITRNTPPITHTYAIPSAVRQHAVMQRHLRNLCKIIRDVNQNTPCSNPLHLSQTISTIEAELKRFFMSPSQIADTITVTLDGFLPERQYRINTTPKTSLGTLYSCGRPPRPSFSEASQKRIDVIAKDLRAFLENTDALDTHIRSPRRSYLLNQGSLCEPKTSVPIPFLNWLDHIGPLLDADALTDTYSIYHSIRFLTEKNRSNPSDSSVHSFSLNDYYQSQGIPTEDWIQSLAQTMFMVETSLASLFESIDKPGWEYATTLFLKNRLGFPQDTFEAYLMDIHHAASSFALLPGFDENPECFLTQFIDPKLAAIYVDMSPYQQNLVKGLVYCQKILFKDFVLAFTAGAKGRERGGDYLGQCGSEYPRRAQEAILSFSQNTAYPQTFSEWVIQRIRDIRTAVLRPIFVEDETETSLFEVDMRRIETQSHPDDIVALYPDKGPQFLRRMTLHHCVSELQASVANSTDAQKQLLATLLEKEGNTTVSLHDWAKSPRSIYAYLRDLGLCEPIVDWLPHDPDEQRGTLMSLIVEILCLDPESYGPCQTVDMALPNACEAIALVKKKILSLCLDLDHITDDNKQFIHQTIAGEGSYLSNADIARHYPDPTRIFPMPKTAPPLLANRLLAYCREEILAADIVDGLKGYALQDLYVCAQDMLTPSAVSQETAAIWESTVCYRVKLDSIEKLFLVGQLTPEVLGQYHNAIWRAPTLMENRKCDLVKTLLQRHHRCVTVELIAAARKEIWDSGISPTSYKATSVNAIFKDNKDILTLEIIQTELAALLNCRDIAYFCKEKMIQTLFAAATDQITPALLAAARHTIWEQKTHSLIKVELVQSFFRAHASCLTETLLAAESHAILRSTAFTDEDKVILIGSLFAIREDLRMTYPIA